MSRFLARLGGGAGKKKDTHSPSGSSSGARPATPSSPASDKRKSRQLLGFGLSSPGNVAERSSPVRNDSTTTTTRSAPPKIELDFGEGAAERSTRGSALQATGIGLYSPITGDVSARPTDAELCNGNGKQPCVISGAEAELLRETKFTWAQVERAWNVAGQEVKVVGLKTADLFGAAFSERSEPVSENQIRDEANRLLAIFTISISSSPSAVLSSFPSLSDYYPPVSFIPQSQEWHDNDFKTNVGWTKDPHVLVRFLKTVTQQVNTEPSKHGGVTSDTGLPEWYHRFVSLERKSAYPADAFSRILSPLITPDHYRALWTIFDRWAVITANAAYNGCRAREVLCGMLGWWLMGARFEGAGGRDATVKGDGAEGWRALYSTWGKARDAAYHLFMAWIRDQEETGTLPLLVLDHVKDYQTRLEEHLQHGADDDMTVLECKLLFQPSSFPASSTYAPSAEDLIAGALIACENENAGEQSNATMLRRWQRHTKDQAEDMPDEATGVLDVVKAIRDARYPHILTSHERNSSTALPQTPTATKDSFYRPFRTPSSSSFMNDSGTPNSTSSPGFNFTPAANQASPSRTSCTPILSTTPNADARPSASVSEESENWTDFAQTGFGEAVAKPKPFVLGEAFKQLKLRDGQPNPQSSEPRDLVMGRPLARRWNVYSGTYKVDSCDTATLSAAFVGFQRQAQSARKQEEAWPPFAIFDVKDETARKYRLCAKHLLVSVQVVQPETKKADSPIATAQPGTIPQPLETPPAPSPQTGSHSPNATDAEKRSRRRSFFRSFSGTSTKNRQTSSVNISSPLESPLPAVVEKREPTFMRPIARASSPKDPPHPAQTPHVSKLASGDSPQATSVRSRSPSSMYRKPVPALDETELRALGLMGEGEGEDSSRASVPPASRAPNGASAQVKTSFPSTTVVDLTEAEEIVTAGSSTTSLSVTDEQDVTKSPTRKRRSGAPSPASMGHTNLDHVAAPSGANGDAGPGPAQPAAGVVEWSSEVHGSSKSANRTISPLEEQRAADETVSDGSNALEAEPKNAMSAPVMLGTPI